MQSTRILLIALALAPIACASTDDKSDVDEGLIDGFHPPAAQPGEKRLMAPLVENIPAGGDLTWCTYIANPFGGEVDVIQSRGFQSKFGHHAILMEVPGAEDRLGQSHECTDKDMTNARFLAGGSDAAAQFKIPQGIAFRVGKASVLMIQTHWINTSNKAAIGQTVFNIGVAKPDGTRQSAQLFAAYTAKVVLPPRAPSKASTECRIADDLKFFAIGGHAHEWGTHVKLTVTRGTDAQTIYDHDWEPHFQADPPLNYYETAKPLELKKGDVLRVDCDYQNPTSDEIRFPREMCVGMGFYFPGTADLQCAEGHWSTGNGGAP